jgi:hypothetical protein
MTHLNKNKNNKNIKNTQIYGLTPKGQKPFFSKNIQNCHFELKKPKWKNKIKFAFLTVRSCPRLLGEHVQNVLQKLTTWIGKETFFSLVHGKERSCPFFVKFLVIIFEWKVRFG